MVLVSTLTYNFDLAACDDNHATIISSMEIYKISIKTHIEVRVLSQ